MPELARAWLAVRRLGGSGLSAEGLSGSEKTRAQGITATHRRDQFIAARRLAREVLVAGWGGTADDWVLSAPLDGPPVVVHGPAVARPHVSISHSGDWLACAAAAGAIGVDIEAPARARDVDALAHAICTAGELERFNSLPPAKRNAHFHALWTLKEAWIKRRAEPATPGRMAQIDAVAAGAAPVGKMCAGRTWQHGGLTLALVTDEGAPVWIEPQPFGDIESHCWTLEDEAGRDRR